MFDQSEYEAFIASKQKTTGKHGFKARNDWSDKLFIHQQKALHFSLEKGRSACFFDTGLGKSRIEGAIAQEFHEKTNKPSLILTPLAIGPQMQRECAELGLDSHIVRD